MSVTEKITSYINRRKGGTILFPSDFAKFGSQESIHKSLSELTKKGKLLRVATGIYYKPLIEKELGLGLIMPTMEQIAHAIAKRDRTRIVPTGIYAQNRLGLSTQVPMNAVYLTDGTPRQVKMLNGREIRFIHIAPRFLNFKSDMAMLLTYALRDYGEGNLSKSQMTTLKRLFSRVPYEEFKQDYELMPSWIINLIEDIYAQIHNV